MPTNNQPADAEGNEKRNHRPRRESQEVTTSGSTNRVRVRTKPLDQVDEEKIALAYWLLAKQIVEQGDDGETDAGLTTGAQT